LAYVVMSRRGIFLWRGERFRMRRPGTSAPAFYSRRRAGNGRGCEEEAGGSGLRNAAGRAAGQGGQSAPWVRVPDYCSYVIKGLVSRFLSGQVLRVKRTSACIPKRSPKTINGDRWWPVVQRH
jgi:hypothetical protein